MSDKRTVSTDALETLGTIHSRDEKRDAIHIAVLPVEAGQTLKPGARVIVTDGIARAAFTDDSSPGIVDPFLREPVRRGQRFWLLLNPRTIQSLRHVWSHPAFPDEASSTVDAEPENVAAKAAIHAVAVDLGMSDEALMEGAKTWLYTHGDGLDGLMCLSTSLSYSWDMDAFWKAYALLTSEDVPEEKRRAFFTCAC